MENVNCPSKSSYFTVKLSVHKTTSDMFRTIWAFKTRELVMSDCFAIQRYRTLNIIILFISIYVNVSAFSILSLSSRRKLVAYLNFSLNFPLKNVYFYQGMTPISKVTTLCYNAFVSICVCNAQCKLKIPIILQGTWSVGILIHRYLHPWLTSLNWKYRKIDKWYTNKIAVNCCQINCQTDQPGQHFIPS